MAPTGIILPLQTLPFDLEELVNDFSWSGTSIGWMTLSVFNGWVKNVFVTGSTVEAVDSDIEELVEAGSNVCLALLLEGVLLDWRGILDG